MKIKIIASGSKGNCYLINDGKTSLLIEGGIPIKQIQVSCDFKLNEVSGCLISHQHRDHCKAVPDLIKKGIDVYAHSSVFESFHTSGYRCINLGDSTTITIGTFKILTFDCEHDVPNLGFLIWSEITKERLLFFTDTFYLKYKFGGLGIIMAECNYSIEAVNESIERGYIPHEMKKRLLTSHMSLEHFLGMLKANDLSRVKQIYLLHLSDNNSRENEFKKAVQELVGCEVYVC